MTTPTLPPSVIPAKIERVGIGTVVAGKGGRTTACSRRTVIVGLMLLLLIPNVLQARDTREEQRIEHLLRTVESLKGAVFIRNGTEYDAREAGRHLRQKLKLAGDRVKTAEDFIETCASRSSISGRAYTIRLADGTITETAPFFRARLRDYDEAHQPGAPLV